MKQKLVYGFSSFLLIAIAMIACSKTDASSGSSSSNNYSDSAVNPAAIDVTTCADATGIDKIICLADAF